VIFFIPPLCIWYPTAVMGVPIRVLPSSLVRKTTLSQKNCSFLFLLELRHISTNFNKFCEVDSKVAETVCYRNIFHLTWPTSPPYLVKPRCSQLLHNVEMYYLQQSIWRGAVLLKHSKLNVVYLVVMSDRIKIVRIRARNVPRWQFGLVVTRWLRST